MSSARSSGSSSPSKKRAGYQKAHAQRFYRRSLQTVARKLLAEKTTPSTSSSTKSRQRYIPITPTPKQLQALRAPNREVFYGGAAGGGKSICLLAAALRHVRQPHYRAIIFRRTFPQLTQAGGLIDVSRQWLGGTDAVYNAVQSRWTFPSGATLDFSGMQYDSDKFKQQGSNYHFIGWDELTHFEEAQYRYMFSRNRKKADDPIPLRMFSTSNPGGVGHEWVKARFVDASDADRIFVSARIADNPHLDQETYREGLALLTPIERKQLEHGDWDVRPEDGMFRRDWFRYCDPHEVPASTRWVRYWDMAATGSKSAARTAGVLLGFDSGRWFVRDVTKGQLDVHEADALVISTAQADGRQVPIMMEQEPGSAGKRVIDYYSKALAGFSFLGDRPSGKKEERAKPLVAAAFNGNVTLVRGAWNHDFVEEAVSFPGGAFKDQIDAAAGAMGWLARTGEPLLQVGGTRVSSEGRRRRGRSRIIG